MGDRFIQSTVNLCRSKPYLLTARHVLPVTYSQATVYNGLVFVAGQLPIKPGSAEKTVGTIEEQAETVSERTCARFCVRQVAIWIGC
jgi:enamine deaminase RidA (YjgF/YER057c/UK114 family)